MEIRAGDLSDPDILALLRAHLTAAHANSPICSAHALDESGLNAPDINFWAAWEGEDLLGVGALRRIAPDHGEIKSMHVAHARRRSGAGSAMLRHIIAAARQHEMRRLSLETGAADYFRPAQALYRKHGFAECPPFGDYKADPNSVFMTLELQ